MVESPSDMDKPARAARPADPPSDRDPSAPIASMSARDWPIVQLSFSGAVTPELMHSTIVELVELAARAEREGTPLGLLALLDGLDPTRISAAMRKEHAELLKQYMPRLSKATCAEARVVTNPIVRGVVTAMSWILPHPWRVEVFADTTRAQAWLQEQCAQARANGVAPRLQ